MAMKSSRKWKSIPAASTHPVPAWSIRRSPISRRWDTPPPRPKARKTSTASTQTAATDGWNQLAIFGRKLAHFSKQFAEDEDVADHFGSGSSSGGKDEWHQMKAEFRGLRDEMKAAIYEKLNSSMEEKRRILGILRRTIDEIRGQ